MSKMERISLDRELQAVPEDVIEDLVARYLAREISREEARDELADAGWIRQGIRAAYFQTQWNLHCVRGRSFTAPRVLKRHGKAIDSPVIMKHWDHERNAELGIDPAELGASSGKSAYFKCPAGKHESSLRQLKNLHKPDTSPCSQCGHDAGGRVRSAQAPRLDTVRPGLCAHAADSTDLSTIIQSDEKVVRWQHPECGHPAYEMAPALRTLHPDDWCPYCSQANRSRSHHNFWQAVRAIVPAHFDVFIDQRILPADPTLPEGERQGREIDVVVPQLGLGWEYNGREHSKYGDRYHESKVERARAIGIELVHVWAADWEDLDRRAEIIEDVMLMCDLHGPVLDVDWEGDMAWVG